MSDKEKTQVVYHAYGDIDPLDPSDPEKELLRAILVGAIQDMRKESLEKRKATEFFLSPEDDYVFSFLSICDYLKIDPNKVLVVTGIKKGSKSKIVEELKNTLFIDEDLD